MATIFWIVIAILIVCNFNWCMERLDDILAMGGIEICLAFVAGFTWLAHWLIFDSWLVSFIVVAICSVGYYKYAG